MSQIQAILKTYYGHSHFRPGQKEIIELIINGKDVLAVMPTGAGKSICYQIPALIMGGITLVISPLISLMKDQVYSLNQVGISAAFLNHSLTIKQSNIVLQKALKGEYRLIYVAPERLMTETFLQFCKDIQINFIAIDEAHCVSQWGQDFRPSYLKIVEFMDQLPVRPTVAAFTATATAEVKEDIANILQLKSPLIFTTGFDRKNLYFEVRRPQKKQLELLTLIEKRQGKSGIIYCATRKTVEEVWNLLQQHEIKSSYYHAGMEDYDRKRNQEDFIFDRTEIMVATNAFGMGIDKSNVSYVIHYNMPKNIESYYQEAGRAGRDGEKAECILLYSGLDVRTNLYMMEHTQPNELLDSVQQRILLEKERERLKQMTFYCTTNDCLRAFILKYFGEQTQTYCGNCSNCQTQFETVDITIASQKILSCIARTKERYGMKMVIDILRGSNNERILKWKLNQQTTYGLMKDTSEKRLRAIIQFLILEGYLFTDHGEYPVLHLTRKSAVILKDRQSITMKLAKEISREKMQSKPQSSEDSALLLQLKNLRRKLAAEQGVPAYIIFTDVSLRDMCDKKPTTLEQFLNVSGVGRTKQQRYGEVFLCEIKQYLQSGV